MTDTTPTFEGPSEVESLRASVEMYRSALARSPYDINLCMVCGEPVVCVPDGMPLCENCEVDSK